MLLSWAGVALLEEVGGCTPAVLSDWDTCQVF